MMCLLFPTLIPTPIQMELDFIVISRRGYSGHRLIPMHVSIRCTDADRYFTQLVPISEFSSIFIVSLHGYQPSVAFLHIIGISLGIGVGIGIGQCKHTITVVSERYRKLCCPYKCILARRQWIWSGFFLLD